MTTRGQKLYQQSETPEQRLLRAEYEAARDEYFSTVEICEVRYKAMMAKYNQWQDVLLRKESTNAGL